MIKTLFLDIDGTLLSFVTHKVPDSALAAIKKAQSMGVKVVISTGRALPLVPRDLGFSPDAYITTNGCGCYTSDFHDIYKAAIPQEDLRALVEEVRQRKEIAVAYFREDDMFHNRITPEVHEISKMLDIPIFPIYKEEEVFEKDIMQAIAYMTEEDEERFRELMPTCDFPRWHPLFTDIVRKGHSKQTGIDHIINYFGYSLDETMGVGDGGNDVEMLQHVAVGVAMGNAADAVKKHADHVTDHVDDDGLAKAIEKFIINA